MKKKLLNLSMLSMALLAGITFTGCSSDEVEETTNVNPTYDGKSVKTQLAISIGSAGSSTRLTEATVQGSGLGQFRGMEEIYLASLEEAPTGNKGITGMQNLANIDNRSPTTTGFNGGDGTGTTKVYKDIFIKEGTKNFLFYAKAMRANDKKDYEVGSLDFSKVSTATNTNQIEFASKSINTNYSSEATATYLLKILNDIAASESNDNIQWSTSSTDESTANAYSSSDLHNLYNSFIKIAQSGSASAILERVKRLYAAVSSYNFDDDTKNRKVRDAIKSVISTYFNIDSSVTPNVVTGYKVSANGYPSSFAANFPENLNLPVGAALLEWNKNNDNKFSYVDNGIIGSSTSADYVSTGKISYPIELAYYVSTPVKAKDASMTVAEWVNTVDNWMNDATYDGWNNVVASSTHSIALQNSINYAVAQLQTKVKLANTNLASNTNTVNSTENNGLKLTGVLVGGQPGRVNYQFLPLINDEATTTATTLEYVVYDKVVNQNGKLTSSDSPTVYTTVFDNFDSEYKTNPNPVFIALEIENGTNTEFKGVDAIVYPGQKFYLIGKLAIATGQEINWTSIKDNTAKTRSTAFPRYGNDRIFVQDFTTTANITINSLQNAYVTIPDLRSSVLSLGLNVDLNWKAGLTLNVDID